LDNIYRETRKRDGKKTQSRNKGMDQQTNDNQITNMVRVWDALAFRMFGNKRPYACFEFGQGEQR
jgi:hypothetical protein